MDRTVIEKHTFSLVTAVTSVTPSAEADSGCNQKKEALVTAVTDEPIKFTVFAKPRGSLTKVLSMLPDGRLYKDGGACAMEHGKFHTLFISHLRELPAILTRLKPSQCLAYGVCRLQAQGEIRAIKKARPGDITRTKDVFIYQAGTPALLMLDYDDVPDKAPLSQDDWLRVLCEACPQLLDTAQVWRASTSSYITDKAGNVLRGLTGQRLYVAVKDGADIPRAGKVLFQRLWLRDHGHIKVSQSGALLVRGPVDSTVFSPERLDFVAGALLKDGLKQGDLTPEYLNGAPYIDTRLALPDLTEEENAEYNQRVRDAKAAKARESESVRERFIDVRSTEIAAKQNIPKEEARRVVWEAVQEQADLYGDFLLKFDRHGWVCVADVLKEWKKYDQDTLADPLEPDYNGGHNIARFYANQGKNPLIHSFAHGDKRYFLHSGKPASEAVNDSKPGEGEPLPSDNADMTGYRIIEYKKGHKNGVYYFERDEEGEVKETWICSPLRITAFTRDAHGEAWGRLLEFDDPEGNPHVWAMPTSLLAGSGEEYRRELLRQGLEISPFSGARNHLGIYLQTSRPSVFVRCVDKTGWHDGQFVLFKREIGASEARVIFQSSGYVPQDLYVERGSLEEWREHVAHYCIGNSRLLFAVSLAFAGALLEPGSQESGGFHLMGKSSIGKSTLLCLAASVWGRRDRFKSAWRATANGMEGLAASRNDSLLILDELAQVDAHEAGEAAYLLANGQGKTRANKDGMAKPAMNWRLLFLSAGEISLSQHMAEAGKRIKGGQEIRLLEIPADAGQGQGVFDILHYSTDGAVFAETLAAVVDEYHGTAGIAFLERLVTARDQVKDTLDTAYATLSRNLRADASGQVKRAAGRFALVAAAGELATRWGITGWAPGAATHAVQICFNAWLEARGGLGDQEEREILKQVGLFFEQYGESRFSPWDKQSDDRPTHNRVGFKREEDGGMRFYVLPQSYRAELCKGHDPKTVTAILLKHGLIEPGKDGRPTQLVRLPNYEKNNARCYVFVPGASAEGAHTDSVTTVTKDKNERLHPASKQSADVTGVTTVTKKKSEFGNTLRI